MIDLSTTPCSRLYTTFGTVVYVDAASGQVRHGAIDGGRANAVLVANQSRPEGLRSGWLMYDAGGVLQPIVCKAGGCRCASSGEISGASFTPRPIQIVRLDRSLIALQSGGLYLCAEPDGRITLSRTTCSLWECFVPSEDWCSAPLANEATQDGSVAKETIDWHAVRSLRASKEKVPATQHDATTATRPTGADRRFARRRVIVIRHRGNLANKTLQYMGALTLANRIKDCTIVNVSIPEWGIEIPDDTQNELFSTTSICGPGIRLGRMSKNYAPWRIRANQSAS